MIFPSVPGSDGAIVRVMIKKALLSTVVASVALTALAGEAELLVKNSGVRDGLAVVLGCDDPALLIGIAKARPFLVHALDADAAKVKAARDAVRKAGLYGRVSVQQWDKEWLPYADSLVNLAVSGVGCRVSGKELARVLAPRGVAMVHGSWLMVNGKKRALVGLEALSINHQPSTIGRNWFAYRKPVPAAIDDWTHFLHGPDNNPVANDTLVTQPRELRWVVGPRWARSHEEFASVSALVSAKGRIFYIQDEAPLAAIRFPGDWHLVARDAFNGLKLWSKPVKPWNDHLRHFRSGPAHLARRLVAVDDRVFVTLGLNAPVTELNAATGEVVRTFKGTEYTEEIIFDGKVLYLVVGTSEGERAGGGLFERGEPKPSADRFIAAVDANSGREIWRASGKGENYVLPLTLALSNGSVFYQDIKGVRCRDAATGEEKWTAARQTPAQRYGWSAPTLIVRDGVVLSADRITKGQSEGPAGGDVKWGVHGWNVPGVGRKGTCKLIAYSAEDGNKLWEKSTAEGYNTPVEIFVVGDTAWVRDVPSEGYNLKTGEPKKIKGKGAAVGMAHHRCYRNKATVKYLFTGRDGIEVVDFEKGWIGNNSWVRGVCQYGIMPANGLIYAPQDACACHLKTRVYGFAAVAGKREARKPPENRLSKGPAYGKGHGAGSTGQGGGSADWPMYRRDRTRGGVTDCEVGDKLGIRWTAEIGGRLTQPVAANGTIFVAATDAHTVHALDSKTGKQKWQFTAGGRIDSAPTVVGSLCIFGAADGNVYCLRALDGQLAWRFQAAPEPWLISSFGQLESTWPVHGAVLAQNGDIFFTAGRSSYLAGGLRFFRMDPVSGAVKAAGVITHIDPKTDKQTGQEPWGKFDSEGVTSDILSGDGESVFVKHMRFDASGKQLEPNVPHLFAHTGFLGEEWFVRSFWQVGTWAGAGWGSWAASAAKFPSGRILCFDKERVYGYGRVAPRSAATGHKANNYHLYALNRIQPKPEPKPEAKAPVQKKGGKRGKKRRKPKTPAKSYAWNKEIPLIVRAMTATPGKLVLAGVPDVGKKSASIMEYENPKEALAAYRGESGSSLWIVDTETGEKSAEVKLPAAPVFDGLSVADGAVLVSLRDGKLVSMKE